jgi:signal transduction histidine kinase
MYRLQFNRVADPKTAESIQLAEVEPEYGAEANHHQYSMVVSAQGENPPAETILKLFDSDPQTKWLDPSVLPGRASWVQWYFVNWDRLPVMRADSASGIQPGLPRVLKLQLHGVVVGANSNSLGFLDETGFRIFQLEAASPVVQPGDEVQLTGQLQFGDGLARVQDPRLEVVRSLANIGEIRPEQPLNRERSFVSGAAEGNVGAVSEGQSYSTVQLAADSGAQTLPARILNPEHGPSPRFAGCRLRVRGVIEPAFDHGGGQFPGVIWVASLAGVELLPPTEKAWAQLPLLSQPGSETNISRGQLVRVRGPVLQQKPGQWIVIGWGTNRLLAGSQQTNLLPIGSTVDVAGFLLQTGPAAELRPSFARPAGSQTIAPSSKPAEPRMATNELTSISQLKEALRNEPNTKFNVKVRGVITYIDMGRAWWYLQDGMDGIFVRDQSSAGLSPFMEQEGQYVELQGTAGGNALGISPTAFVKVLGKGRLPAPLQHSLDYLLTGSDDYEWVQLNGIVTAFEKQRLTLNVNGGQIIVWVNELDRSAQNRLLGSPVRVSGVCSPVFNNRQQRLGVRLLVPSAEYVEMVRAAPENPFDLPLRSIGSLMQSMPGGGGVVAQLVKISGVVTYREPRLLFVQNGADALRVFTRDDVAVDPGDRVDAVGLAAMDGLSPKLVQALIRKTGQARLPAASPITVLGLDSDMDQAGRDATRGSVEATLLGTSFNDSAQVLQLKQDQTEKTFLAYLPLKADVLAAAPVGSRVRLEGAFKAKTDSVADFGQVITSFEMYLNSPADIVVLARPPWWTGRHILWVLGGLSTVLLVALAWAALLRNQVRRRTRELQSEVLERQRMETELIATSRRAGMAEVATNVLHNVGNVLNSVNISSSLLADKLRKMHGGKLVQLAALLDDHRADLGNFLMRDAKGRQIPLYLKQLAKHLDGERDAAISEMDALRQNVEHIKAIVTMQQTYARVAGVTEVINVTELVEGALRTIAPALQGTGAKVIREYAPELPTIIVDRHKALQILVNLITNAKHACAESGHADNQIKVGVLRRDGWIEISVADNGVGIPPENLTRIFNHGFTTRRDGHGFGLHGGALAAKELGGTLVARSDGSGKGATFVLQLPA